MKNYSLYQKIKMKIFINILILFYELRAFKLFVMKKKLIAVYARAFTEKIKYFLCAAIMFAFTQSSIAQQEQRICGITAEYSSFVNKRIVSKIAALKSEGKLNTPANALATPVSFRFPLSDSKHRDFPVWRMFNFVDIGSGATIKDYNCGSRSYDGHTGIDILLEPYYWKEKTDQSVWVVAAAPGVIVDKHDGEFDEQCAPPSSICTSEPDNRGNYVVILHDDGSTASLYMHMLQNSVTTKQEGDRIETGEYLGIAGSSGCSSAPHLHFEVRTGYVDAGSGYENTGTIVDPFANGSCATSADSWWINEPLYTDPAVLTLETHSSNPEDLIEGDDWCDKTLLLYEDNSFSSGQTIWFRSKFRDWISGSTITENIYRPNGTLWHSFTRTGTFSNRAYIPLDQSYTVSLLDNAGTYRYTVDFNGKTYSHYFSIACATDNTLTGAVTGHKGTMVSNQITSTQTISGSSTNYVKYMADARVILNPGFQATAGCRFVANTLGCNNSTNLNKQPEPVAAVVANNAATNDANKKANGLRVFPNPSTGIFTMQFSSNKLGDATVAVKNMMGQIVYALPQQKNISQLNRQINLSSMPKGIYIVEVNTGTEKTSEKVLIQ